MPPQGAELNSVTDSETIDLQQSTNSGAAESGAVGPDSCQFDSRLQEIIDAWSGLSIEVQTEIIQLIQKKTSYRC